MFGRVAHIWTLTSHMHILHVTRETSNDARYGIGKSLLPVVLAFRAEGHTVDILDANASQTKPCHPLTAWLGRCLHALARWSIAQSGTDKAAANFILEMVAERVRQAWIAVEFAAVAKVTHVHCHDPIIAYFYWRFALIKGVTARWGITEHAYGAYVQERPGVPIPPTLAKYLQIWERSAVNSAAWVCAPSQQGLHQLGIDLNMQSDGQKEHVVPVTWHRVWHPKPVLNHYDRGEARRRLGIPEDEWILVAVGQLLHMKRFPMLIEACGLISPRQRPYLIILGEGDQTDIISTANRVDMAERVRIDVTDDIGLYFSATDLYVSTSATESFGMANCEAMTFGLPAVCTAVGAVPEILGDSAWLVGDTPEEIAVALTTLRNNADLRARYSRKAHQWALAWPSPEQVAQDMLHIYSSHSASGK
jgi:glycosyltransferase involved in cell wall biosynthesis